MVRKNAEKDFSLPFLLAAAIIVSCLVGNSIRQTGDNNVLGAKTSPGLTQIFAKIKRLLTWKTFKSDQYGYSLRHPKNWEVKDKSTENSREVVITEPKGLAIVMIAAYKDDRLKEEGMLETALKAKEQELRNNPKYQISGFEKKVEGKIGAYTATGRTNFSNSPMLFLEKGMYDSYGKMIFMHGGVAPEQVKEYLEDIKAIMDSFKVEKYSASSSQVTPAPTSKPFVYLPTKPPAEETPSRSEPSFTIAPPPGWLTNNKITDPSTRASFVSPERDKEKTANQNIDALSVISVRLGKAGEAETLDNFVQFMKTKGLTGHQEITILSDKRVVFAGQEAHLLEVKTLDDKEAWIRGVHYLLLKNNYAVDVVGLALNSAWEKRAGEINASLQTFAFSE